MLYIIRHGRTDWNNLNKLQGGVDIPLNEEGRQMAKIAHDDYNSVHFDRCYTSPLSRAKETASILLENRDVPIIIDDRLRELSFGDYEGELYNPSPLDEINLLFEHPESYVALNNAESLDSLFLRVKSFLDEVVNKDLENGLDVLIVGHGALNSCINAIINNLPREKFWSLERKNCRLIKLR